MKDDPSHWQERILTLLNESDYRPMKQHEIARQFGIKGGEPRAAFRRALYALSDEGRILKITKSRWALPAEKDMVVGTLTLTNSGNGFLAIEDDEAALDVFVPSTALNGARHKDRVRVALSGSGSRQQRGKERGGKKPSVRDRLAEGAVDKILERGRDQVAGLLLHRGNHWYLIPDDPRMPARIRVDGVDEGIELQEDWRAVAQFLPDEEALQHGHLPAGRISEILGPGDDLAVEMMALMRNYELTQEFPEAVVQQAKGLDIDTSTQTLSERMDLREVTTFTIDPVDARDFDDALSVEFLENDLVRIGIHIADVSHYIQPDTPIDLEARERATSVYLADRVVTMLPEHLTNHVCSLVPHADRLTHSVMVTLDPTGRIVHWDSGEAVIHSDHRFTYGDVQTYFDSGDLGKAPKNIQPHVDAARKLGQALRKRRFKEGALTFNVPEVKLLLDDDGRVSEILHKSQSEANHLVEEYMLLANQVVARALHASETPTLYRVHEEPSEDQWKKMAEDLAALGIKERPEGPADLERITSSVAGKPNEAPVTIAILKNLNRAHYTHELREHYGLAFEHYVHFTSPIRRYPDMIVHRGLKALEKKRPSPHSKKMVATLGSHCSIQEQQAESAEKESIRLKLTHHYQQQLQEGNTGPYAAFVSGINPRGLMIELEESGQRGMVAFTEFGNDYYEIDQDGNRARGRSTGKVYAIGDKLEVGLVKVDMARRLVDFAPWGEPGKGGSSGKRSDRSSRGPRKGRKKQEGGDSKSAPKRPKGKTEKSKGKGRGGRRK